MKKWLIIFCMLILLPAQARALHYPECDCGKEACICFIQAGDEGPLVTAVLHLLIEEGYCPEKQRVDLFDEGARQGVIQLQKKHGLEPTGVLDDATLTLLIWGVLPEELDKWDPSSRYDYNWVPTDGGIRRHRNPECSKMYDPRKISVRNAEALGYTKCGRCNREDKPIE